MNTRRQHFVIFSSPGTFFDETTSKPIESWDVKTAVKMAAEIREHDSRPYGFHFETAIIADRIADGEGGTLEVCPRTVETSAMYYLDGEIVRFDSAVGDILRSNMRSNRHPIVCRTTNGYQHVGIFTRADFIVSSRTGEVLADGNAPELEQYRAAKIAEWESSRPWD